MRFGILSCLLLAAGPAFACTACFGDPNSSQTHGMNAAILTLLGTTVSVLGIAALVAGRIAWRAYHPLPEAEMRAVIDAQPMTASAQGNETHQERSKGIIVEGRLV